MTYLLLTNVDLNGGDLTHLDATSFDQGVSLAKSYINGDTLKCAVLQNLGSGNYRVWFKDIRLTNPSNTKLHQDFVTIVYGKQA